MSTAAVASDLKDLLFSRPDRRLINIKITRGDAGIISPETMQAEICSIIRQHERGLQPSGPAQSMRPKVNVREFCRMLA